MNSNKNSKMYFGFRVASLEDWYKAVESYKTKFGKEPDGTILISTKTGLPEQVLQKISECGLNVEKKNYILPLDVWMPT